MTSALHECIERGTERAGRRCGRPRPGHRPAARGRGPGPPSQAPRTGPQAPAADRQAAPAGHHGPALALILAAAFMVVLDFSIVNVALPSIQRELGFAGSSVQWIVTGYAISFGGLLILGGRAADLFGRRRMFMAGLVAFSAASLAGGLAHDPVLLVASRFVQGAGAALVAPAALSLITTGFAEGPRRTRALGMYGATASLGFVAGQVLGGVLVQFTSWRAVFLVNVPVGLLAVALAPGCWPSRAAAAIGAGWMSPGRCWSRPRWPRWCSPCRRSMRSAGHPRPCWRRSRWLHSRSPRSWAPSGIIPDPLVRAGLLGRPGLRTASTMNALLGLWNAGEMIVLSLYFQQVLHDSALATGLAIAPQGVVGLPPGRSAPGWPAGSASGGCWC